MTRITKQELHGMFRRFCRNIGATEEQYYLENAPVYGGWLVAVKSGEIVSPFSNNRLSAREMYQALHFANCVLEDIKYRQQNV